MMERTQMPISAFARRFVERAFERMEHTASQGSGAHDVLMSQDFTDSVNGMAARTKRQDLREYILSEAHKHDLYNPDPNVRWIHDEESNECHLYEKDGPCAWRLKEEPLEPPTGNRESLTEFINETLKKSGVH